MKKFVIRSGISLATVAVVIAGAAAFSAYEAHIVNVTATIDNATNISTSELLFGQVFPQEVLHQPVTLSLSQSFTQSGALGVDYVIKQKPKCIATSPTGAPSQYAPVTENSDHIFVCPDGYQLMPLLCPFLSKTSDVDTDTSIPSFHGPTTTPAWTDTVSSQLAAVGHLTQNNPSTTWDIDLHVPCFKGECAQDWASYVHTANANAIPENYMLDPALKGQALGCDLWYELTSVNRAPTAMVGAKFADYVAPTCTVTVSGGDSIQAAINQNAPGSTICVDSTYNGQGDPQYPIVINKDGDILAGLGTAGSASLPGGVRIDNDSVTVKGLTIHSSNFTGEIAAVYLSAGVDNATVKFNELVGPGKTVANSSGLINVTGFTTTGLTFDNNKSHDWLRGIFLNDSTNMTLTYNTLTGNGVGSANDHPHGNMLTNNLIKNNTIEGVGVFNDVGDTFTANTNSIYDNNTPNSQNDLHNYGTVSVNAENNWWGDANPADNVAGTVDYSPSTLAAYGEN